MTNAKLIRKLNAVGKLPAAEILDETDFPLKEFDGLLQQFILPIDFDTAAQLVNLSPPVNRGCYGIEWALVHLVESVGLDRPQQVLDNAGDGEVKRIIQVRLNNYNKAHNAG